MRNCRLTRFEIGLRGWLLVFLVAMAGCALAVSKTETKAKVTVIVIEPEPVAAPAVVPKRTDITNNGVVQKYLAKLTPQVRERVSKVFSVEKEHLAGLYKTSKGGLWPVAGHCHSDQGIICLAPDVMDKYPSVLWHEGAHAYHSYLRKKGDFDAGWKPGDEITEYAQDATKTTGDFIEDVAEWVGEITKAVNGENSVFDSKFDWTELRRSRPQHLVRYRFISQDDLKKFLAKYPKAKP